jgi:pimeloyl-ACP methyl ester carboxylesterase
MAAIGAAYQIPLSSPVMRTRVHPQIVRAVLKGAVNREHRWPEEDVRLYADQYRRPDHAAAASAVYRTFLTRELQGLLRGRYAKRRVDDVRVTLAAGGADTFTGPHCFAGAEEHVSDLTTHVIEGAGHFVPEEKPREVAEIILSA